MFNINKISLAEPIDFAASELKKYLRMMMPEGGDVKISYAPDAKDGFRLGLMSDFGLDTSDAEDVSLDDILYIDADEKGGIIAGSNPRSVLLSVYEYLRQNGCRWLFPGVDGEFIPMQDIKPVKYRHEASSRIRGNCIEGNTSQKMLREFIDFLPKVGLNTFMIQFRVPFTFYDRFYVHNHNNANFSPEPVSRNQTIAWTVEIECEMAKRGLVLHSYGHGFTTDPFGIDSAIGWAKVNEEDYSEDTMKFFAQLNGKRCFFKDQPLNTQVCMSNPEARKKIADYVADYARRHQNINYLHIWLADSYNNHCECENCAKHRPSDLYITLLNDIDRELTKASLPTRLVAIVYVDTFWCPEKERFSNSDRFTLMVAPITRDYTKGYDPALPAPELLPYERNKLVMPKTLEENIAYYKEWQKFFDGDRFVFEYHFWRHQNFDLGGRMLAKRIYDDVVSYRALGEQGIIECGSQRSFFPNGYPFYTHARALFDSSLTLEEIERDYHECAYGDVSGKVTELLEKVSDALPYDYVAPMHAELREEKYATPDCAERFSRGRALRDEILALVKENYNSDVRVRTVSVRLLEYYCTYLDKYIDVLEAVASDDKDAVDKAMLDFKTEVGKTEPYTETCFDFGQATGQIFYHVTTKTKS
jgi:hypothetical protein